MNIKDNTIGLASDHAGFNLKEFVKKCLEKRGIKYVDFGTFSNERCDYPDFAHKLGTAIDNNELEIGIAMCGTGNGIAMTLNKHQHVRAGLCWNAEIAHYISAHNNANVLVMPARYVTEQEAEEIINSYLDTPFEGDRHQKRIDKIPL